MPDESRVKPQPLQPEERAHLLLMLRTRPDRCDPYTCGKAADEIEALATIEEARREQPVSDAVQAVEALSVMYDEYGGKVPADVLRAILDNFERNAPARREQPVSDWKSKFEAEHARASELQATLDSIRREQPVRGTDADSLRATLNTVEFRNEVHPFLIEYVRKFNQTSPVGYSFDSTDRYFWDRVLLVIGDYLAAAPKEGTDG